MNMILEPSQITPFVKIDAEQGVVVMKGQSSLERSLMFYHPLIKQIYDAFHQTGKELKVDMSFRYFNTSSSKCFLDLFRALKKIEQSGSKVSVNWYYERNDSEMKQMGEDYADLVDLSFNYIEILRIDKQYLKQAV